MTDTLEFDILLKNMKYDQLMTEAIRSGEYKRAINISRRRHQAVLKIIKRHGINLSKINSTKAPSIVHSAQLLDDQSK